MPVLSKYDRLCPCQEGTDYLGITSIFHICPLHTSKAKLEKLRNKFFMGNGIIISNAKEASKSLLFRDHKDLATLNENYYNGLKILNNNIVHVE